MTIEEMMKRSHATAVAKGWWDMDRSFSGQIALQHSELSEALEQYRMFGLDPQRLLYYDPKSKPEGIAAEFADVLIRIADTCAKYDIPLVDAIEAKLKFNESRPRRHGNKLL